VVDEAPDLKTALIEAVRLRFKSERTIARYSKYIEHLSDRGVSIILSFDHLADSLGIQASKLHAIAFATHLYYRSFQIPKRTGGWREIMAPTPDLDLIQRWIAENILKPGFQSVDDCVTAYTSGRSILTHVAPHIDSLQLIKLDIKDFFPSITTQTIFKLFESLGYTKAVARTLAAVTTVHGHLPQGSPSSPLLSNLVMSDFDLIVNRLCAERSLIYTRYADDLVVSGNSLGNIRDDISSAAEDFGFTLNQKKTTVYTNPAEARFVTGLLLRNGIVRLPKQARRRIRIQTHLFIQRLNGKSTDIAICSKRSVSNLHASDRVDDLLFADRLLGRLQFWSWVEKEDNFPRRAINEIRSILASI
jgi:hypothetical protein